MEAMPHLGELNGHSALFVDGEPFFILSLQWDCDSCYSPQDMDPLFPEARKMGCNTAALPLYWREVEPEEGRFDFRMLDHRIQMARANELRLVLIWFGTYKNGCLNYAPDWVKGSPRRFRRARSRSGQDLANFACPTCREMFEKDRACVEAIFRRIRETDADQRTVVLFQMENETGILGTDRCCCEECEARFSSGGWDRRFGARAAEAFSAHSIATFCDGIAAAAKAVYQLPVYMNSWVSSPVRRQLPGVGYPSGGPVAAMLDIYRETLKSVDFIAPDIYTHGYRDLTFQCKAYQWPGNPLYVAEHSSGPGSRAERNVFYALGEHAAIGFDPWAIDRAFPDESAAPLVHPLDQRWSAEAYSLRDSYVVIRDAMIPIVEAQGTDRLRVIVQEDGEEAALLEFADVAIELGYRHRDRQSRGVAVRLGASEWLLAGVGLTAAFARPGGRRVPIQRVERGIYRGRQWRCLLPVRREGTDPSSAFAMREAGVFHIWLGE